MPHALVVLLCFLGQVFWDAKPPEQWSDEEIRIVLGSSPWVQTAQKDPPVFLYLATAAPIEAAHKELRRRSTRPLAGGDPDYTEFLELNRGKVIVVAIPWAQPARFGTEAERRRMTEESMMVVGRKKYHLAGHFAPSPSDPTLRLVFPREVQPSDKSIVFRLYLPAINFPEREVEFWTKDLEYRGKVEM